MRPRYSVVIPCYNEARYIADAVRSLRGQTFAGSYEIVVVDNNCTDDTAAVAAGLGARVVHERTAGVCAARQTGTEAAAGDVVVSADADTTYPPDWLSTIDRSFRADAGTVAVTGPCRYVGGPLWGRVYARLLFGGVQLVYRLTGRIVYVSATNIAFRKDHWSGYDLNLTQGGDELHLLRALRGRGRVVYHHRNPTYTSSRRLTRGLLYSIFVTLITYYLLGYALNRLFGRRVIGTAPAYRDSRGPLPSRLRTVAYAMLALLLLTLSFAQPRRYLVDKSDAVVDHVTSAVTRTHHR